MLIDFHIHMADPKSVVNMPVPKGPDVPKPTATADRSPEGIKKHLREMGLTNVVVQHMALQPGTTKAINDFARELAKDEDGFFFQYGAFHPDDDPDDLKELKESGVFYGVKLHPYLQKFVIDDKKMYPAYEMLSSLNLPVLFHTGIDYGNPALTGAFPERILKIHRDFPKLTIIAAHLGAFLMYDEAEELIIGQDMFIDVATSVTFVKDLKQYERILKNHDPDKILFGSDYGMGNPAAELEYLQRLNLSADLMDKIMYKNAQRLLGI